MLGFLSHSSFAPAPQGSSISRPARDTAGPTPGSFPPAVRVAGRPEAGFLYPYYLYVPPELREENTRRSAHTLLVLPNNSGTSDDPAVPEADAQNRVNRFRTLAAALRIALLAPAFPRPKSDSLIYTHALDRDSLLTPKKELRRFDLQLIAMIDDARGHLAAEQLSFDERVFMYGFSAGGMFTNRFAFLHPDRVKAAAFGSPGGWAIAPVPSWKGEALRYPIGTADFKEVSGANLDLERLKKVPLFLFMGSMDTNDSVVYRDSYDQEDQDLIFRLFGKTLMERWPITEQMYTAKLPEATLKLYPNVDHSVPPEILKDVTAFFSKHLSD
jgi:pimeloyl-ACP methyl ester carboxylesterase